MSELPHGVAPGSVPTPRMSASAVVLRADANRSPKILLGERSRTARFMPGHLACPGGVLDEADGEGLAGLAVCASRELFEECALTIDPTQWLDAGFRVTPPMFPRRFHTQFFVAVPAPATLPERPEPATEENERLEFMAPQVVLAQWETGQLQLPPPILPILRSLVGMPGADAEACARAIREANALEEHAPRIEFSPRSWMLPVRSATLPPATHTNVWMPGESQFVIVDPGCDNPDELERLVRVVERRRAAGDEPRAIWLTHHHQDHHRGAIPLARRLQLPLAAHPLTWKRLAHVADGLVRGTLRDGQQVDLAGVPIEVLHTPGHAEGHLTFFLPRRRVALVGDLISGLSTILIDPDSGEMNAYLESLERVARLKARLLFPGHGPPLPASALGKLIAHRRDREARIIDALRSGTSTLDRIADAAYCETADLPPGLIRSQTLSHLRGLQSRGLAVVDQHDRWTASESGIAAELIERLRSQFEPLELRLDDQSAQHVGHAGAVGGGGHFRLRLVSARFEGLTRVEQHRLVYRALGEWMGREVHALALDTRAPSELL